MAVARAWSVALLGVQGTLVEVEADLAPGLPGMSLVRCPFMFDWRKPWPGTKATRPPSCSAAAT